MARKMTDSAGMKQDAENRAAKVLEFLALSGVEASVVGSLGTDRFDASSDVDFLVSSCPKHLKYRLEARVEDLMGDFKFDVIYADETPAHVLKKMTAPLRSNTTNA